MCHQLAGFDLKGNLNKVLTVSCQTLAPTICRKTTGNCHLPLPTAGIFIWSKNKVIIHKFVNIFTYNQFPNHKSWNQKINLGSSSSDDFLKTLCLNLLKGCVSKKSKIQFSVYWVFWPTKLFIENSKIFFNICTIVIPILYNNNSDNTSNILILIYFIL